MKMRTYPKEIRINGLFLEDLLASDQLFLEYFNAFLSLPTFPEPLVFNPDLGVFELADGARQDLAAKLKAAVRACQKTARIYKPTRAHSFRNIPLIPIESEDQEGERKHEIKTTFSVTTLSKEQGLHWVKANRLTAFLDSDLYLEWRLARIVAQTQPIGDGVTYSSGAEDPGREVRTEIQIDYEPHPAKVQPGTGEPVPETPQEFMDKTFVSLGNSTSTDAELWVSHARSAAELSVTGVYHRPISSPGQRPQTSASLRPYSAVTFRTEDSGFIGSEMDDTTSLLSTDGVPSLRGGGLSPKHSSSRLRPHTGIGTRTRSAKGQRDIISQPTRSMTPRPNDVVCSVSDDFKGGRRSASAVYVSHKPPSGRNSVPAPFSSQQHPSQRVKYNEEGPEKEDDDKSFASVSSFSSLSSSALSSDGEVKNDNNGVANPRSNLDKGEHQETGKECFVLSGINELSAVIVGVVVKHSLAQLADQAPSEFENEATVQRLIPNKKYRRLSLHQLSGLTCIDTEDEVMETSDNIKEFKFDHPDGVHKKVELNGQKSQTLKAKPEETTPVVVQNVSSQPAEQVLGDNGSSQPAGPVLPNGDPFYPEKEKAGQGQESEEESILDSEDDYEEGDSFFRRTKHVVGKDCNQLLTCKKGVESFKKFIAGSMGEKHWNLWLDIDKCRKIRSHDEEVEHLEDMRRRYLKSGSPKEIPHQVRERLGLIYSCHWTTERLLDAQPQVAEALITYWAPRYVLNASGNYTKAIRQSMEYTNLMQIKSSTLLAHQSYAYPVDSGTSLLPLRPKSCAPRLDTVDRRMNREYDEAPTPKDYQYREPPLEPLPSTAHPMPLRRTHSSTAVKLVKDHARIPTRLTGDLIQTTTGNWDSGNVNGKRQRTQRPKTSPPGARSSAPPTTSVTNEENGGPLFFEPAGLKPTPPLTKRSNSVTSLTSSEGSESDLFTSSRRRRDSTLSSTSEFLGGMRMEKLLKALNNENQSGKFFRKHLHDMEHKNWEDCLLFWEMVKNYHILFAAEAFDPYQARRVSEDLFSRFLVRTARRFIGCTDAITASVASHLRPPFEELFDEAEEYCLGVLLEAWSDMFAYERKSLSKIDMREISRQLETRSKFVVNLKRKGIISGRMSPSDDPMEGYEDPVYDENIMGKVPEEYQDYTLEKMVRTPIYLDNFRQFLQSNFASTDLACWMDIEQFRRLPPTEVEEMETKAKEIKLKYFNKKYLFSINSPAGRDGLDQIMAAIGGWGKIFPDRPPDELLVASQAFVRARLEKKWLPHFLMSDQFADLQKPSKHMVDAADALLLMRKRNNQMILKMLQSKWETSSQDIITFRQALLNPIVSFQFQRYVSVKSETLENDVIFWREVQKYKKLYHAHSEESFIQQKVTAIINCFINSVIPPSCQLHIKTDQADKILDNRRQLGPYLFRDAQLTVFRVLHEHWAPFCEWKKNIGLEEILPTLERQKRRATAKDRRTQRELLKRMEAAQEKERARRKALGMQDPTVLGGKGAHEDGLTAPPPELGGGGGGPSSGDPQLTWSYSKYIQGLDREELLDEVDGSTFSMLDDQVPEFQQTKKQPSSQPQITDTADGVIDMSEIPDVKAAPGSSSPPRLSTATTVKSRSSLASGGEKRNSSRGSKGRVTLKV